MDCILQLGHKCVSRIKKKKKTSAYCYNLRIRKEHILGHIHNNDTMTIKKNHSY